MRTACLIAALASFAAAQDPLPENPFSVAGRVNDGFILWYDVYDQFFKEFGKTDAPDRERLDVVLRKMIEKKLIYQEARRLGITVTEIELDEDVDRAVRAAGGRERFERDLLFRRITESQFREERRVLLYSSKVISTKYVAWITTPGEGNPPIHTFVSPKEIRDFFESQKKNYAPVDQTLLFRIAFKFKDEIEKKEKRRLAESVKRKVDRGAEITLMGKLYGDMKDDAEIALTLDRKNDKFSPHITELIFEKLKEGEVSDIVEDRNSLNIFRVAKRIQQKEITWEEAQPRIRAELENQKHTKNHNMLLKELSRRAYVTPERVLHWD